MVVIRCACLPSSFQRVPRETETLFIELENTSATYFEVIVKDFRLLLYNNCRVRGLLLAAGYSPGGKQCLFSCPEFAFASAFAYDLHWMRLENAGIQRSTQRPGQCSTGAHPKARRHLVYSFSWNSGIAASGS